jgi:hypothetical protein
MSLPARQEQELKEIEGGLICSDPRLRSLFAIFSRLHLTDAMPWFEVMPSRPVADRLSAAGFLFRRIVRRPAAGIRALLVRPAALIVTAAVSVVVCGIMIAAGFPGPQRTTPTAKPPAARELVVKPARMCRLGMIRFPAFTC